MGRYDVEVTTFQMTVLFAWNQRPKDKISYESLKLATELPDAELRRTLWVNDIVANFPFPVLPLEGVVEYRCHR